MAFLREKQDLSQIGEAQLVTTVPELAQTVLETLRQLEAVRDKTRNDKCLDYINDDYRYAKFGTLTYVDVGKEIVALKNVYNAKGELVVDEKGRIVATLTGDSWSRKAEIGSALAKELSKATGKDIRVFDIIAQNLFFTAALEIKDFDLDDLDYTECTGTPIFEVDGSSRCAFSFVYGRGLDSDLYDGRSGSGCAARLFRVRGGV